MFKTLFFNTYSIYLREKLTNIDIILIRLKAEFLALTGDKLKLPILSKANFTNFVDICLVDNILTWGWNWIILNLINNSDNKKDTSCFFLY